MLRPTGTGQEASMWTPTSSCAAFDTLPARARGALKRNGCGMLAESAASCDFDSHDNDAPMARSRHTRTPPPKSGTADRAELKIVVAVAASTFCVNVVVPVKPF